MNVWKTTRAALKGVAHATYGAAKFVGTHQEAIASTTRTALHAAGSVVKEIGAATATGGRMAADRLNDEAAKRNHPLAKVAAHAGAVVGRAVQITGSGVQGVGALTKRAAPAAGATAGGFALGGASIASEVLDSVAIQPSDIDVLRAELATYGERVRAESEHLERRIAGAQRARAKDEMLDLLVVGGMSLAYVLEHPDAVPDDIQQAFQLAYPDLALHDTFASAVERLPAEALPGLVSGVKGKLFEIELVDHFNHGGLPDGLHADLAGSATQPGWDIRVLDAHNHVVDLLQAKATESAQYVLDALHRYPGIDVISTSEVHAHLLAMGLAEHVTNSGIAEAVLDAHVQQAAEGLHAHFGASDLLPSGVGMAVIGLSLMLDKNMTWTERGTQLGSRGARAGAAGAAAKVAMVATQTWWIGLIAGVGSRWLAGKGRSRREQYEALRQAVAILRERYDRQPPHALPAPGF